MEHPILPKLTEEGAFYDAPIVHCDVLVPEALEARARAIIGSSIPLAQ